MNEKITMSRDATAAFIAAARRLRDGMDRYGSMVVGLSAASSTLSADCIALVSASPAEARAFVEGLMDVATGTRGFRTTIDEFLVAIRIAADGLSKVIRTMELEMQKDSR